MVNNPRDNLSANAAELAERAAVAAARVKVDASLPRYARIGQTQAETRQLKKAWGEEMLPVFESLKPYRGAWEDLMLDFKINRHGWRSCFDLARGKAPRVRRGQRVVSAVSTSNPKHNTDTRGGIHHFGSAGNAVDDDDDFLKCDMLHLAPVDGEEDEDEDDDAGRDEGNRTDGTDGTHRTGFGGEPGDGSAADLGAVPGAGSDLHLGSSVSSVAGFAPGSAGGALDRPDSVVVGAKALGPQLKLDGVYQEAAQVRSEVARQCEECLELVRAGGAGGQSGMARLIRMRDAGRAA